MTANCFLANKDYTIYNALSWGYCKEHYLRASVEGPWVQRLGHGMIATLEFIPVISQIASLFEMAIASLCEPRADTPIDLSAREVRPIDPIELPLSPRNQLSSRFDIRFAR